MQHSELIIDEIVTTLEKAIGNIDDRLSALEAETGVEIIGLDPDDPGTGLRHNQLVKIGGGGLKQWNAKTQSFRTILNGVEAVRIEADTLVVERSDGSMQRWPIKMAARAAKPKAVAV